MQLSPEQQKQLDEQKAQCPFCKLASGEYPSSTIYEDEYVRAMLDIRPAKQGHVLVISKEHYPILALMPQDEFKHTFKVARDIAYIFRKTLLALGTNLFIANGGIAGQQIGHFSYHMIPRDSDTEMRNFVIPKNTLNQAQYQQAFTLLKQNIPKGMQQYIPQQQQISAQQGMNRDQLAQLLDSNPQLKQVIMQNPEYFKQSIKENPQLAPLFVGIDIDKLSQALNAQAGTQQPIQEQQPQPVIQEQVTPIKPVQEKTPPKHVLQEETKEEPLKKDNDDVIPAIMMTDNDLENLLNLKESLKEMLLEDLDLLRDLCADNKRLQKFFEGSSIKEVSQRAKKIFGKKGFIKSIEDAL